MAVGNSTEKLAIPVLATYAQWNTTQIRKNEKEKHINTDNALMFFTRRIDHIGTETWEVEV